MKRRNFLKDTALLLGAPVAVASTGRLYGAPASIQPRDISDLDKFKLPLSRAAVPVQLWDNLAKIGKLWENVLTNDVEGMAFHDDPRIYFDSIGLDSSDRVLINESVVMLRAMADPELKNSLAAGNYEVTFSKLIEAGVLDSREPSALQSKIENVLEANIEELRASIATLKPTLNPAQQQALLSSLSESGLTITDEDLASLSQVISQHLRDGSGHTTCSPVGVCLVNVLVGIAVAVVAYISVVVAATVGILAGAWISLAVQVAVGAGGGPCGPHGLPCPSPFSSPFKGNYLKLDPNLVRNTDRAIKFAMLANDSGLQMHATRTAIEYEVKAIFSAMKNVKLITISDESFDKIIEAVTRYSWKSLGIDVRRTCTNNMISDSVI